ncbi:hypothetical protein [Thiobacillus sp.]|uniref:hypothetical protein n=1 Tax=Thiobacillus sp. TaxID=924 RepID=UPI00286DBD3B|nr:hypothetical protein [Thiobacillus sp.]
MDTLIWGKTWPNPLPPTGTTPAVPQGNCMGRSGPMSGASCWKCRFPTALHLARDEMLRFSHFNIALNEVPEKGAAKNGCALLESFDDKNHGMKF